MDPAQFYRSQFGKSPSRILLLKGHSAGIGDLLRSSAAWRALRTAFPQAELHLVFLTKDPGAASEVFIARHHLLRSFCAIDKRTGSAGSWRRLLADSQQSAARIDPDLIIDCEPDGLKTSLIAWLLGRRFGAVTVGIAEFPGRGMFYRLASDSTTAFARSRHLPPPLEYTNRDFVSLSALGIEREGRPIELEETGEGRCFREKLRARYGIPTEASIVGLNIGCGTPDAVSKRPDLKLLREVLLGVWQKQPAVVLLTGAKFEQAVNREFLALFTDSERAMMRDLAGETNLFELCGAIRACELFISTDSGPYHMAVGLKVPTLAVFRGAHPVHYHYDAHVRCRVLFRETDVAPAINAASELLVSPAHSQ